MKRLDFLIQKHQKICQYGVILALRTKLKIWLLEDLFEEMNDKAGQSDGTTIAAMVAEKKGVTRELSISSTQCVVFQVKSSCKIDQPGAERKFVFFASCI
ncbi:hypothetical protein EMCRGX_G009838 [Ephydatia muelleri]